MSLRALNYVFEIDRTSDGKPISRLGRQLLALIAGHHLEWTGAAKVPLDHIQILLGCAPAGAENYAEQLVTAGLVEIVQGEEDDHLHFIICGLAADPDQAINDGLLSMVDGVMSARHRPGVSGFAGQSGLPLATDIEHLTPDNQLTN
jgi:hypothetical protein